LENNETTFSETVAVLLNVALDWIFWAAGIFFLSIALDKLLGSPILTLFVLFPLFLLYGWAMWKTGKAVEKMG
jgi:hypothetical protein